MEFSYVLHEPKRSSAFIESATDFPERVSEFLSAARARDTFSARRILDENSLLIWFYIPPVQLASIVDTLVKESPGSLDACSVFQAFLAPEPKYQRRLARLAISAGRALPSVPSFYPVLEAFNARLEGRVAEAYEMFHRSFPVQPPLTQFRDPANAWPQFLAVQKGITATLAGQLFEALGQFQGAMLRTAAPHFEFLTRDALVKSSLIHATFGDPRKARALLEHAQRIPRTASWVEEGLDASMHLASALVQDDAASMMQELSSVDSSQVGEMWPFYVHAHYRVLETAHSNSLALQSIDQLKTLPFAAIDGQGYPGSVFHLAEASLSITAGAPQDARKHLENADQTFILTRILKVLLDLQVGANEKAAQLAAEIRNETLPFRRMELWRISMLAQAHANAGRRTETAQVLSQVRTFPHPLTTSEVTYFSTAVRSLAGVDTWGSALKDHLPESYLDSLPSPDVHLSPREHEVLLLLASGLANRELAAKLFISVNTLKSQLRSIYRKLDARSREEALRNAAARGIL